MGLSQMSYAGRRSARAVAWFAALATLAGSAACSNPRGTNNSEPSVSTSAVSANPVADAKERLKDALAGTFQTPDTTARPAVKGKKIIFVSAGQSSTSSSVPAAAAMEAAQLLGWDLQIYDSAFNPAVRPKLVRDAIAAGADGIILNFDCPFAQNALQEAKDKGIKIVPLTAYDCNDKALGGNAAPAMFSGRPNLGPDVKEPSDLVKQYGGALADATIVATDGKAKVIMATDPNSTTLRYVTEGFEQRLATCGDCSVVAKLEFASADLGPTLQQKISTVLAQHPEANAFRSPYSAATLLGIAPAIVQAGREKSMYVVGGEGGPQDMDLIRTGKGLNACAAVDASWGAWSVIDLLNSLFLGQEPKVSGIGTIIVDKDHNLPATGPYVQKIDYRSAYKKAWGIG
jgi:ribose transport system substrate-binding protein